MSREPKILSAARRLRVLKEIDTAEHEAVLSNRTISRIEQGKKVTFRSAVLYCKALGVDPDEYILKKRVIPIIEQIDDSLIIG